MGEQLATAAGPPPAGRSQWRQRVSKNKDPDSVDIHIYVHEKTGYGFSKFVGDVVMTVLTAGFWLIWIFVREMRKR